jgi:hypothetical protein
MTATAPAITLRLALPARQLSPNVQINGAKKAQYVRHSRQNAFFATLKALGVPSVPSRIMLKDRPFLGITHNGALTSSDYIKLSKLLFKASPPTITGYTLHFHFPTKRRQDDDNVAAMFKSSRDGIADALQMDDRNLRILTGPEITYSAADPHLTVNLYAYV